MNSEAEEFLHGQVALVTGSARRSGSAMVRALAAAGAAVIVNAKSSRADARRANSAKSSSGKS